MATYLATLKVQLAGKSYETKLDARIEASTLPAAIAKGARQAKASFPGKRIEAMSVWARRI